MTHSLRLNLQLHTISLVRTCRISSFCTVAWQLARLLLTRRIARSLGDSGASCSLLLDDRIHQSGRNFECRHLLRVCCSVPNLALVVKGMGARASRSACMLTTSVLFLPNPNVYIVNSYVKQCRATDKLAVLLTVSSCSSHASSCVRVPMSSRYRIACVCWCAEQHHKAALTPDILTCIEDCVVISSRVMNDLHSNVWSDRDFSVESLLVTSV